jgi:peptidoglycan/LPS O-acetylase OafA/YrhL
MPVWGASLYLGPPERGRTCRSTYSGGLPPVRVAALDGVRGIAILLVLLMHAPPKLLPGGNIGVDLFFVLSGFLITSLLEQEHKKNGSIHFGNFFLRRALRLFPALLLLVLASLTYVQLFERENLPTTVDDAASVLTYWWNLKLAFSGGFEGHQLLFAHLWSLSIEEQFYIAWPFILFAAFSLRLSRKLVAILLLLGLALPAIGRLALWNDGPSHFLYVRTDLRLDGLVWGVLAAYVAQRFQPRLISRFILGWSAVAALVVLLWLSSQDLIYKPRLYDGFLYRGGFSLVGFLSAVLVTGAVLCPPTFLRVILEFAPLRWIGRVSYGLYLWHYAIACVVIKYFAQLALGTWWMFFAIVFASFAVASASYYFWEIPWQRLKQQLEKQGGARTLAEQVS